VLQRRNENTPESVLGRVRFITGGLRYTLNG